MTEPDLITKNKEMAEKLAERWDCGHGCAELAGHAAALLEENSRVRELLWRTIRKLVRSKREAPAEVERLREDFVAACVDAANARAEVERLTVENKTLHLMLGESIIEEARASDTPQPTPPACDCKCHSDDPYWSHNPNPASSTGGSRCPASSSRPCPATPTS